MGKQNLQINLLLRGIKASGEPCSVCSHSRAENSTQKSLSAVIFPHTFPCSGQSSVCSSRSDLLNPSQRWLRVQNSEPTVRDFFFSMFLQGIENSQTPQSSSNLLQKSLGIPSSSSHPGGMCLWGTFPSQPARLCQTQDYTCTLGMSGVGLDFPLGFGRQPRPPPKRKKKRTRKTSPCVRNMCFICLGRSDEGRG